MPHKKIAIHGLPRSGTSWVGEIFNSSELVAYRYQPLFSYAFKNYLGVDCTSKQIDDFFEDILQTKDPFVLRTKDRESGKCPYFEKSSVKAVAYKEVRYHYILPALLRRSKDLKVVLVIRNPLSVVNSWLNAPREFRSDLGWKRTEEWRYAQKKNLNKPEEYNGYERWKEATQMFFGLKQIYPERIYLLHYNSLIEDSSAEVETLFQFLNLPMGAQIREFLMPDMDRLDTDPYSVNKLVKRDNKWKTELEPEIQDAIEKDLFGTNFEYLLKA